MKFVLMMAVAAAVLWMCGVVVITFVEGHAGPGMMAVVFCFGGGVVLLTIGLVIWFARLLLFLVTKDRRYLR